ncbi:hypothetical protein [Herbaspirillum rhizosphaerae]|uniref:hypothetical protein n=1 Tax=Herbaspirillum rhizosphaerae TaxID=346179 RepID=UPI000A9275CF|nr:hypothetical protein [Herbaspirillum rhizosphaerae]
MRRNKFAISGIFIIFILSGCQNLRPLPVREPTPTVDVIDPQTLHVTKVRREPDGLQGGLIPAKDLLEAKKNVKIYSDFYNQAFVELKQSSYSIDDTTFLGGLLGVIGGVAKSVETAATGGVIAAGGSVVSSRYSLEVQAANYRSAYTAMRCMWRKISVVSDSEVKGAEVAAATNELIDSIREKLRDLQADIKLVSPDLSNLKNALEQYRSAPTFVRSGAMEFTSGTSEVGNTASLISDLKTCVAAFSS